ncbi:HPt (histidine-containing phosphotransfer) domain-containing protein [Rhodopseudomonas thermotolerans]|uniref:HPt (Histidine-containing phosphotransfer) domain-containing protein n=3 Tax=Nitrobacteraceae TaxID=41294 RepID=A0A336JR83_9BRAD|nr:HPt (histidine-containing phosphotransfer) domain-containing protein [Rhodopseudomonas pentothenatexigens]REG05282.1 HPt (histidine-containing phosphotransfer) domain-containing protein [Rhodopseudomonas thermotolerans]SSW90114.1 HPt (histidine-containing phosphotransfer) domain-containing protein [Rhodopseudomonas pentothenatexigens]
MPLQVDRIEWMPSPPLVPDLEPIDDAHLRKMTLGDVALEHEVLLLFTAQAASLMALLASWPADAAALAHTLKGSARSIGAFAVADAAAGLEDALRRGEDAAEPLAVLEAAVDHVRIAIDDRVKPSRPRF